MVCKNLWRRRGLFRTKKKVSVAQSCLTLCDPKDCSPPGFSLHGISQARILEWVAVPSSRGSFRPRDRTGLPALQADSLPSYVNNGKEVVEGSVM